MGIIGTDATIRSGSFVRALHAIDPATETVGQGCALLVPLVENGYIDFENKVTRLVLEDYLRPIRESGADTLILGCTHFPLLAPIIGDMLGEGVTLDVYKRQVQIQCNHLGTDRLTGLGVKIRNDRKHPALSLIHI